MNIQPLHNQILVHPFAADEMSTGGIIVPENARERSSKATVVATGKGVQGRPMRLMVGDVIFHVKGAGTELQEDGTKYYLMTDRDVLCTLV